MDEIRAEGWEVADFEGQTFEVWPENWDVWLLYTQISNQWRMAFGGPYALDYSVLFTVLDRQQLTAEEWQLTFSDIRVIESAALDTMSKQSRSK